MSRLRSVKRIVGVNVLGFAVMLWSIATRPSIDLWYWFQVALALGFLLFIYNNFQEVWKLQVEGEPEQP
jgi:hypothetical protein